MEPQIDTVEDTRGGVESRRGFIAQDHSLITELIAGITDPNFQYAYTELHEDYILIFLNRIEIVQVKTREPQLPKWSINKDFCEGVLLPFYQTSEKITGGLQKRFIFKTNGGLQIGEKSKPDLFHTCKITDKGEGNCSTEEKEYIENVIKKVADILKKPDNDEQLRHVIWNFHYKNIDEISTSERSNRDFLQDQLMPLQINHNQTKIIYDRLLSLITRAGAEENERNPGKIIEIMNTPGLSEKDKKERIAQVKRCITKEQILEQFIFPNSPFIGTIQIFPGPIEPLKFQRMMQLAKINEKQIALAAHEYFNIEYHRRLIGGILGTVGCELLDHSKGIVYTMWGTPYATTKDDDDFGKNVYAACRTSVKEGLETKMLVTPVLQHEVHAYGLLHELAEEDKITYRREKDVK